MVWTQLPFGKHRGKTLPQTVFADPDWFFWACQEGAFKGRLADEAEEIARKARHIRIPGNDEGQLVVEYAIHPPTGKLGEVRVLRRDHPAHVGSSDTVRKDHFDLSVPRRIAPYDKWGNGVMVRAVKDWVFDSKRVTRQALEAFFADDGNFF